jgi:hypothetical protein
MTDFSAVGQCNRCGGNLTTDHKCWDERTAPAPASPQIANCRHLSIAVDVIDSGKHICDDCLREVFVIDPKPEQPPVTPEELCEKATWLEMLGGMAAAIGGDLRELADWMERRQ